MVNLAFPLIVTEKELSNIPYRKNPGLQACNWPVSCMIHLFGAQCQACHSKSDHIGVMFQVLHIPVIWGVDTCHVTGIFHMHMTYMTDTCTTAYDMYVLVHTCLKHVKWYACIMAYMVYAWNMHGWQPMVCLEENKNNDTCQRTCLYYDMHGIYMAHGRLCHV